MKKQLTTLFLTAAALLMPLALTSCDEELQISEKVGSEPKPQTETIFSSMPSDTRTSMASTADSYNKYPFYWETGDKIWVDKAKNGSFTLESGSPSINASNRQQASFVFQELLTGSSYDLVYTGSASTRHNQVTIKNVQEQQGWNNSAHIGTSGDCATATASQTSSGNYSFTLNHKAHYLVLKPYLNSVIRDDENCKLTKIEIVSDNTIAGTYQFSMSGLNTGGVTGSSSTITLNCTGTLPITATSTDACFVVIQPGTHTLTIKYTITSSLTPDETFTFEQDAFTKDFKVNGVTTIRHELTPLVFTGYYYRWGAANRYYHPNWDNTTTAPTQLTSTMWKDLPNVNAVYSYVFYGDPRFDHEQPWILNCDKDFSGKLGKRGVWVKKRAYCSQFSETLARGMNQDLRNYQFTKIPNRSTSFRTGGRPDKSVIDQYFFLPCCGHYHWETGGNFTGFNSGGGMWAKSPRRYDGNPTEYAIHLSFGLRSDADGLPEIAVNMGNRLNGIIAAPSWFK